MKRLLMIGLVLMLTACVASAQSFPATKTAVWPPSPTSAGVTSYKVWIDAGTKATVLPAACTATECTVQVVIPVAGTHTLSVTAVNAWGEQPVAGVYTFAAAFAPVVVGVDLR